MKNSQNRLQGVSYCIHYHACVYIYIYVYLFFFNTNYFLILITHPDIPQYVDTNLLKSF